MLNHVHKYYINPLNHLHIHCAFLFSHPQLRFGVDLKHLLGRIAEEAEAHCCSRINRPVTDSKPQDMDSFLTFSFFSPKYRAWRIMV